VCARATGEAVMSRRCCSRQWVIYIL